MSTPAKLNFKVYAGTDFNEVLRWESSLKTYVPITGIANSAPLVVTAPAHGVPNEWRVRFTNILGMTELNNSETYYQVTNIGTNTLTINDINSISFKAYASGGIVEYNTPVNLSGFTAKMQIKDSVDSTEVIRELNTENGGIIIDNIGKVIILNLSASITSAFTFTNAYYALEVISAGNQATLFCVGNITVLQTGII